jgi:hypothetical protein
MVGPTPLGGSKERGPGDVGLGKGEGMPMAPSISHFTTSKFPLAAAHLPVASGSITCPFSDKKLRTSRRLVEAAGREGRTGQIELAHSRISKWHEPFSTILEKIL